MAKVNKKERSVEELFGGPIPSLKETQLTPTLSKEPEENDSSEPSETTAESVRFVPTRDFACQLSGGVTKEFKTGCVIDDPISVNFFLSNPGAFSVVQIAEDAQFCPHCRKVI